MTSVGWHLEEENEEQLIKEANMKTFMSELQMIVYSMPRISDSIICVEGTELAGWLSS